MSKFLHGVESVTRYAMHPESIQLPPKLVDLAALIERIAENGDKFQDIQIPCDLYYVTTAQSDGSSTTEELQVKEAIRRINDLGVYEKNLRLHTQGHEQLAAKQKERLGPQKVRFHFEKKQTIPTTNSVESAYIGIAPASEILKLITDENGVRPGIFEDNVRLHLGSSNPVNQRIQSTLESPERTEFPFLNNGLTVISTKAEVSGDNLYISGYQIVNGGQTSHQLVAWSRTLQPEIRDELLNSVWVPIKVIVSSNADVRSRVAVATNLQTAIGNVDIQATSQSAKDVEEFFDRSGAEGLRYERQGRGSGIHFARTRVVGTSELNRAVAAALFGESSRAIASPKELERENSFVWGNYPVEAYYYAAWLVYRVDRYFARTQDRSVLRAAKYHIAMMVSSMLLGDFASQFAKEDTRGIAEALARSRQFDRIDTNSPMRSQIEDLIPKAAGITEDYFSLPLAEGRSLRKDDVRSRRHQQALLQLARAYVDGEAS